MFTSFLLVNIEMYRCALVIYRFDICGFENLRLSDSTGKSGETHLFLSMLRLHLEAILRAENAHFLGLEAILRIWKHGCAVSGM